MANRSVTIRDVAQHAEVSVASVSRVFNGHDNVHPDTKARVEKAAKALGYFPHAGARSLSLARTHAIGVVLPDLHGEFFSELLRGMDREAGARGFHLLLSNMHADAELAAQAMRSMRGRVDGAIVMAPQLDAAGLDEALPASIPTILLNAAGAGDRPIMRVDNRAGIEAIVRHLVAGGRRALVHIAGPHGNIDAGERRDAFADAMARHAPGAPVRIVDGDFREEAGLRAATALLAEGAPMDAIVAANDMMALGAMLALREAGVAVPDRVAVTGFDDVPLARYLGLTTAGFDIAGLGARTVARLIERMAGGTATDAAGAELVVPTLMIRATTGWRAT